MLLLTLPLTLTAAKPSDHDVAQSVAITQRVNFFAKKHPVGYVPITPVGTTCCAFQEQITVGVKRAWTPNGCSAMCNETAGRCNAFSFITQYTLCVMCSRCNATATDKEWRSFARKGSPDALAAAKAAFPPIATAVGPGPDDSASTTHGLVSSSLADGGLWEQLAPRTERLGSEGCDVTSRKGRRGLRASCSHTAKRRRCAEAVEKRGRGAACAGSCYCSRCSPACADFATQWRSPFGLVEARATASQPRFTFAYSPYDVDTTSMVSEGLIEPAITRAWHGAVSNCCSRGGGSIIDVGGNYGWYTLFSLAMGCSATVVEPIRSYQQILRHGLALNPGFGRRTRLYSNVIYSERGVFNVTMPQLMAEGDTDEEAAASARRQVRQVRQGMAGMATPERGVLKMDKGTRHESHEARAISIDDICRSEQCDHLCALKIDVEGYEPQAFASGAKLLSGPRPPPVVQFELNKFNDDTPAHAEQMCAFEKTLTRLEALGYRFRELPTLDLDRPLNASHSSFKKQLAIEQRHLSRSTKQRMTWRSIVQPGAASWEESAIFPLLPQFPSVDVRSGVAKRGQPEEYAIVVAYREFRSYSTNLVGVHDRRLQKPGIVDKPWPRPSCGEDL